MPTDLILIRTRAVSEANRRFAEQLRCASAYDVRLLVDERAADQPSSDPDVISLNRESLASLGLFVPHDVGWRCGDYGVYLARKVMPGYRHYWIMDDDARVGGEASEFFAHCDRLDHDLLGINFCLSDNSYYWWPHAVSRNARPFRCLFCMVRLSAAAVDTCYAKRRRQTFELHRRMLWPNDEALVATTVVHAGLSAADFKVIDPDLYSDTTFSVTIEPVASVPVTGPPRLWHPVRLAERPRLKTVKNWRSEDAENFWFRVRTALGRRINALTAW